ncbi:MAG: SdpI family protein [Phototrophicaceae bacterium]
MTDNTQRNGNMIMLASIGLMLAIGLILYPSLPDELPRQWGIDGTINSTWSKFYAVLFAPAISIVLWILTYIIPKVDPKRDSYDKFGGFYMRFRIALVVFFLGMHIITLTQYDNPNAVMRLIVIGVSALFAVMGNELGRVRPTWFFGIRTPWTISDERVWTRTHRIGGRWFVGLGIINMILALILPAVPLFVVFMGSLLTVTFGLTAYSYVLHRRLNG